MESQKSVIIEMVYANWRSCSIVIFIAVGADLFRMVEKGGTFFPQFISFTQM
jgi:hypothetical protein